MRLSPTGGGTVWSYAHAIDVRPQIAGTVVVGAGQGELFALEAATGRVLWTRRSGGSLRGAGDDGKTTVVSLGLAGDAGSVVLVVAHDGTVVRQLETGVAVGVPAVTGPFVFLPWQGQYVTIYDTQSGNESARMLFREQVSRAFSHGGKLYFGELGVFRFDENVWQASKRKASHVSLPARPLPGDPKWFRSGHETRGPSADAYDKIALYAAPNDTAPLAIASDKFVATYYKIVSGLDARDGSITWTKRNATDFIAGSAFDGGAALCDASGHVTMLGAATGEVVSSANLGQKLMSCAVEADGLPASRAGTARPRASLSEQIADVVGANDNEMVAMQRVLLRELAKQEDPNATKYLVDLASDTRTSEALLPEAEAALAARRSGAEHMIQALRRHYDFLRDVLRPPPVGPLADALLAMKEVRAAPVLVSHLLDPADTTEAIKRVAAALAEIATKAEVADLRTFFGLYRATAEDEDLAQAVVSVARALVRVGGPEEKTLVSKGAEDPLTVPLVRLQLAAIVETSPPAP
jgi:outer membrane protein assembly factor BamB